jgi:hypothetical protein
VTNRPNPYDARAERSRLQRYRILLESQTDQDIRVMLEQLIAEAEKRLSATRPCA